MSIINIGAKYPMNRNPDGIRYFKISCPHCLSTMVFSSDELIDHKADNSSVTSKIKCELCSRILSVEREVAAFDDIIPVISPQITCCCGAKYISEFRYNRYIKRRDKKYLKAYPNITLMASVNENWKYDSDTNIDPLLCGLRDHISYFDDLTKQSVVIMDEYTYRYIQKQYNFLLHGDRFIYVIKYETPTTIRPVDDCIRDVPYTSYEKLLMCDLAKHQNCKIYAIGTPAITKSLLPYCVDAIIMKNYITSGLPLVHKTDNTNLDKNDNWKLMSETGTVEICSGLRCLRKVKIARYINKKAKLQWKILKNTQHCWISP